MRATSRAPTEIWEPDRASNENIVDTFGPYLVFEELVRSRQRGGLATVHRAIESHAHRLGCPTSYALKRLRAEHATEWELVNAFIHEARLTSQLRHDHIARTHAYGRIDGTYYTAMELVEGPSLRQVMTQCRTAAGAMPVSIAVALLVQLCEALDYLHSRDVRIVHRDLSPANIIVSRSGRATLVDFALVKTATARPPTELGVVKGTLAYTAPETLTGVTIDQPPACDQRADLFAVGVIAHELLTGRSLFGERTTHSTMRALREKRIAPPSRANPAVTFDLDDIVLTALARDPERRWQNGAAFAFALRAVASEIGVADRSTIREWARWAFERKPRRETRIARVIDSL